MPQTLKEKYEECIPKFKTSICDTFLPRCSSKCEPLKMCESELRKVQNECLQLVDYLKWVVSGGQFRNLAVEQLGSIALSIVDPWSEMILGSSTKYVSASNASCDVVSSRNECQI